MEKKFIAYYAGNQPFRFFIEKAVATKDEDKMIIEGIASTLSVDHDQERMALPALIGMARIINEKTVPLRIEHQKEDEAVIGKVFEGQVDERGRLHIKAELDPKHPMAKFLYNAITSGTKLGLSVGGEVLSAFREIAENLGKAVRTFYDVKLNEVSVTPRPSNFDAWLINKSIIHDERDANNLYDTPIYDRFLFDNPHLDYLAVIEKSIPADGWKKVDDNNQDFVMKLFEKDATIETSGTTTMSSPTSETSVTESGKETTVTVAPTTSAEAEGEAAKSRHYVDEKIDALRKEMVDFLQDLKKSLTAISDTGSALNQEQPVEEKIDSPSTESVISDEGTSVTASKMIKQRREGQEDIEGNGDNTTPRESGETSESMTTPALDQRESDTPTRDVSRLKSRMRKDEMPPSATVTGSETTVTETAHDVTQQTARETGSDTTSETTPPFEQENPDVPMTDTSRLKSRKLRKAARSLALIADSLLKEADSATVSTRVAEIADTLASVGETLASLSSEDSSGETLFDSDTETASEDKDNSYGEEYMVGNEMKMASRRINELSKLQKSHNVAAIDLFVAHVSDMVRKMQENFEKQGKRVLGLEAKIADLIRGNEEIQKSMQTWLREPGVKKSVVMNIPYMIGKDGKRYPLADRIDLEGQDITKSRDGRPKDFKELYQEKFSSTAKGEIL